MGAAGQGNADAYAAWLAAALDELEGRAAAVPRPRLAPRAAADLAPAERAGVALAQVVAALAAEARIEAAFDTADHTLGCGDSFADYHRQFPEPEV